MAHFCNQCAIDMGGESGDFAYLGRSSREPLQEGEGWIVVCEGCGFTLVDNDGNCLGGDKCSEVHHKEQTNHGN
jgi:hypothetical protein